VAVAGETRARAAADPGLERYRAKIQRHIRSLVRDRGDAEDLTQETLLRAHEQLASLRDRGALGVWLYRIATSVCHDHLRRAVSQPASPPSGVDPRDDDGPGGAEERIPDDGPSLDQLADNAAMSACGERLLDTLPDAYRAVLLLHDLQGLTAAEIGRLTRCTPGSVKIRLHRARQRFREALARECDMYRDERGVLLGSPKPRRAPRSE
jgi:RNA polymerase sigma-70 factor (ECF subfamily)